MPVHHVALRTPDPAALAAFYACALGLGELRRTRDAGAAGTVCSVWLDLGGSILMVERGAAGGGLARAGDGALAGGWDGLFVEAGAGTGPDWEARWAEGGVVLDGRTAFTLYARDPEGNRFGISSFPSALFR
ncbi:MAG: lactoylglutathione lyase [Myxococcales bacterium]|nr:lactoylglutathione lyase [Myxococcales bacterium]